MSFRVHTCHSSTWFSATDDFYRDLWKMAIFRRFWGLDKNFGRSRFGEISAFEGSWRVARICGLNTYFLTFFQILTP